MRRRTVMLRAAAIGAFLMIGLGCANPAGEAAVQAIEHVQATQINERFIVPGVVRRENGPADIVWGYIDGSGREVIPPKFQSARDFSEGRAAVQLGGKPGGLLGFPIGGWGFIDRDGKVVVPHIFENVGPFSDGRAAVENKEGKWGFISLEGRLVIPPKYAVVSSFSEGLAGVSESGNHYSLASVFIDTGGKVATESGFMNFHPFNNGRAIVRNHGGTKARVIDTKGKVVFTAEEKNCRFSYELVYRDGLLAFEDSRRKWGFWDIHGKVAIEPVYDEASDMHEGFATVRQGDSWGVIDRNSKTILPVKYKPVERPKVGTSKGDFEQGIRDRDFEMIISLATSLAKARFQGPMLGFLFFDEAALPPRFSGGFAFITTSEWSGYVNARGERVIKAEPHRFYGPFERGLAPVYSVRTLQDQRHLFFEYIDTRGTIVFERDISEAFISDK